jgi:hypothetical protein
MTGEPRIALPNEFGQAATTDGPKGPVAVAIDPDVFEWIRGQFSDPTAHINDLLRFFMDTSRDKEREFDPDAWDPGEMDQPPPEFTL